MLPDRILGLLNFSGLALQMFNPRPLDRKVFGCTPPTNCIELEGNGGQLC